jgi:hypothetical protein
MYLTCGRLTEREGTLRCGGVWPGFPSRRSGQPSQLEFQKASGRKVILEIPRTECRCMHNPKKAWIGEQFQRAAYAH